MYCFAGMSNTDHSLVFLWQLLPPVCTKGIVSDRSYSSFAAALLVACPNFRRRYSMYRPLNSHGLTVRHTVLGLFSRSHVQVKYLTSNLTVNLISLSRSQVFCHGSCFKFLLKYKLITGFTRIIIFVGA